MSIYKSKLFCAFLALLSVAGLCYSQNNSISLSVPVNLSYTLNDINIYETDFNALSWQGNLKAEYLYDFTDLLNADVSFGLSLQAGYKGLLLNNKIVGYNYTVVYPAGLAFEVSVPVAIQKQDIEFYPFIYNYQAYRYNVKYISKSDASKKINKKSATEKIKNKANIRLDTYKSGLIYNMDYFTGGANIIWMDNASGVLKPKLGFEVIAGFRVKKRF